MGRGDPRDYYQFTLTATATVDLGLSGLGADANLSLYDSRSTLLASSALSGTANESISRNLGQGSYHVLISQGTAASETHFRLSAAATTISFDGAGQDRAGAKDLGVLDSREKTFNDWISSRLDASDFYKFSVASTATLNVKLDSLRANADMQLLTGEGLVLASAARSGNVDETITRALTAGDYYVRLLPAAGAETDYRLRLSASTISVDGAGNSTDKAFDIGLLDSRERIFNDWVSGTLDANDFYHFRLAGTSNVQLGLTGLAADADVRIVDGRGGVLASGLRAGIVSETLASTLAAGEYWLRVSPGTGMAETNYRLTLHADAVSRDKAGNTRAQALNVGTLDERPRDSSDWISGRLDPNDWYQFNLTGVSQVSLKLSSSEVNADLQLLNSQGVVLTGSATHGAGADEVIQRSLSQGSYYVRVSPADPSASGNYQLTMSAPLGGIVDNAPNTRTTARDLATLDSRIQGFDDWVSGSLDANDWYHFRLADFSTVRLRLTGIAENADIQLVNSTGGVIARSALTGTSPESLDRLLAAGDYYVRVYPNGGTVATNYHLTLQADSSMLDFPEVLGTAGDDQLNAVSLKVVYGGPGDDWMYGLAGFGSQRMVGGSGSDVYVAATNGAITVMDLGSSSGDTLIASGIRLNTDTVRNSTAQAVIIDGRHLRLIDTASGSQQTVYLNDWLRPENRIETFHLWNFSQTFTFDQFYQRVMAMRPLNQTWEASGAISGLAAPFNFTAGISALISHMGDRASEVETVLVTSKTGDVGDTPAAALDLGTISSAVSKAGTVSDLDLHDYYRFTVATDVSGQIRLDVSGGDADIALYASNGRTVLASSRHAGTQGELITRDLAAGAYYIAVDHYSLVSTYTLTITPTVLAQVAPDNTPGQAHDLGNLSGVAGTGSADFADRVDNRDTQDYFKFSLSASAQVEFALTGMSADADLYLYSSDGVTRINFSNNAGSADENLDRALGAGTYYVAVKSYSGNGTNYRLSIEAKGAGSNDAGDTQATARDLGNLLDPARGGTTTASDRVSPVDEDDFFKFSLSGPSRVNLSLTGLSGGDADVSLLKADGGLVDVASMSVNLGTADESLSRVLDNGTYYVWVSQYEGATPYNLRLLALGAATDAAGNTLATAAEVGSMLDAPYVFTDRVDAIDRNDFYHFALGTETNVSLQLDGLTADADLRLLAANGSEIVISNNRGGAEEKLNRTLAAGSYYLHVTPFGAAETNYRLIVNTGLDPNDFVSGQEASMADIASIAPYDRVFRSWAGGEAVVFSAGEATAELFQVADNSQMNISLAADGVRDGIAARGIAFGRSSSHFVEIDGKDLLAWDTQSRQAFRIADWHAGGRQPGHFELGDGSFNLQEFLRLLEASPAFVSGVSSADIDLGRDMSGWMDGLALSPQELAGSKHLISGTIASDFLSGFAGNDFLLGQSGNDTLAGASGNDTLAGGKGQDVLTGGAGDDSFVFDSLAIDGSGADTVSDFSGALAAGGARSGGIDRLIIDSDVFGVLTWNSDGSLATGQFVAGPGMATASRAEQHLLYDTTSGKLYFDQDGSGFDHPSLLVMTFANKAVLAANDFMVG